MHRMFKVVVTIAVFAGGAGMLLYSSLGDAEYYHHVDELMESPESWEGKNLRVHGFVEPGSLQEDVVDQRMERNFVLEREGKRIEVSHAGPAPDTFRELSEVVAIGTLVREGDRYVVEANELTAKCPSKYDGDRRTSDYAGDDSEATDDSEPSIDSLPGTDEAAEGY